MPNIYGPEQPWTKGDITENIIPIGDSGGDCASSLIADTRWILVTGYWADEGFWLDNETWVDEPPENYLSVGDGGVCAGRNANDLSTVVESDLEVSVEEEGVVNTELGGDCASSLIADTRWILVTGYWADEGFWLDNETWVDEPPENYLSVGDGGICEGVSEGIIDRDVIADSITREAAGTISTTVGVTRCAAYPISGLPWILVTGYWDDNGFWDDFNKWID